MYTNSDDIGVGTGGGGGARGARAPQYFALETLLIFRHAAQIGASNLVVISPVLV